MQPNRNEPDERYQQVSPIDVWRANDHPHRKGRKRHVISPQPEGAQAQQPSEQVPHPTDSNAGKGQEGNRWTRCAGVADRRHPITPPTWHEDETRQAHHGKDSDWLQDGPASATRSYESGEREDLEDTSGHGPIARPPGLQPHHSDGRGNERRHLPFLDLLEPWLEQDHGKGDQARDRRVNRRGSDRGRRPGYP